ncbi:MAG TPA: hypothetical protein VFB62_07975 [Polyangiaceae bacterium]|jgi:cytochrome c553|nr:hypothetical protein [Polyangiaceae bacterium]
MKYTICIFAVLALVGCNDDETEATCDASTVPIGTGDAARGMGLFSTCGTSSCHGDDGDTGLGGKMSERVPALSDAEIAKTIKCGTDTPAISGSMIAQGESEGGTLSDQEIADVIAHLRVTFPNP